MAEELPLVPLVNVKTSIEIDDRIRGVEDAVPDYEGYFLYPENLRIEEYVVEQADIKKYEIEEDEMKDTPRYDRVNILAEKWNKGKVTGGE